MTRNQTTITTTSSTPKVSSWLRKANAAFCAAISRLYTVNSPLIPWTVREVETQNNCAELRQNCARIALTWT